MPETGTVTFYLYFDDREHAEHAHAALTVDGFGCRHVDPPEDDPGAWVGEAKIAGRAVPTGDGFRVDITEAALTYLAGGRLVIESWHPGRGRRKRVRD